MKDSPAVLTGFIQFIETKEYNIANFEKKGLYPT
jgi:hypothetical protein